MYVVLYKARPGGRWSALPDTFKDENAVSLRVANMIQFGGYYKVIFRWVEI